MRGPGRAGGRDGAAYRAMVAPLWSCPVWSAGLASRPRQRTAEGATAAQEPRVLKRHRAVPPALSSPRATLCWGANAPLSGLAGALGGPRRALGYRRHRGDLPGVDPRIFDELVGDHGRRRRDRAAGHRTSERHAVVPAVSTVDRAVAALAPPAVATNAPARAWRSPRARSSSGRTCPPCQTPCSCGAYHGPCHSRQRP